MKARDGEQNGIAESASGFRACNGNVVLSLQSEPIKRLNALVNNVIWSRRFQNHKTISRQCLSAESSTCQCERKSEENWWDWIVCSYWGQYSLKVLSKDRNWFSPRRFKSRGATADGKNKSLSIVVIHIRICEKNRVRSRGLKSGCERFAAVAKNLAPLWLLHLGEKVYFDRLKTFTSYILLRSRSATWI